MDKAEGLKDICFKWLWKAFETGTKQDSFSANNSEYWHPAIDLDWSKKMANELQQYADEQSREEAERAWKASDKNRLLAESGKLHETITFNYWWKSNQEGE